MKGGVRLHLMPARLRFQGVGALMLVCACAVPRGGLNAEDADVEVDATVDVGMDARPDDADVPDTMEPDVGVDASGCVPGEMRCFAADIQECVGGVFQTIETCDIACVDIPPRCTTFTPSNISPILFGEPSANVMIGNESWDTGACAAIPHPSIVADGFCVVSFGGGLTVTGTLDVTGTLPLIILARGDITITGVVNGAANGTIGGPSGGTGGTTSPATGAAPGSQPLTPERADGGGGGGGSSCGSGGDGGAGGEALGGAGGLMVDGAFVGGSGGGAGDGRAPFARGGGGGGAIQITSLGRIQVEGSVNVAGAGGSAGLDANAAAGGGGGGYAIIESALEVVIPGAVHAGGGGGGGAGGCDDALSDGVTPGGNGDSFPNAGTAPSSCSGRNLGAPGGDGSDGTVLDGDVGGSSAERLGNGGGGGGGPGCVQIRAVAPSAPTIVSGVLSLDAIE